MTVQCFACARFSGKVAVGEGKLPDGFGRCALESRPGHFVSALYWRDCETFQQADDMAERQAWADKRTKRT